MAKISQGDVFGRLTVASVESWKAIICACACGNTKTARSSNLLGGKTTSCGCLRRERNNHTTHGRTGTLTHKRWRAMRARCLNKNASNYQWYGGAGITVCERWNDFEYFLADMGECTGPEMTIERADNSIGYTPGNCRWATKTEQARNQRSNRLLPYRGETRNVSAWAELLNIPAQTILNRLRYGWPIEQALSTKGDARANRRNSRAPK